MDYQKILENFQKIGRLIFLRKHVDGSGGNISLRIENCIYITCRGQFLNDIKYLAKLDLNGNRLNDYEPSSEWRVHVGIYNKNPDIKAIIHTHSLAPLLYCEKLKSDVYEFTIYEARYFVRKAKILDFYTPGSEELANEILKNLDDFNVFILKKHGLLILGKDLWNAFDILERVNFEMEYKLWLEHIIS